MVILADEIQSSAVLVFIDSRLNLIVQVILVFQIESGIEMQSPVRLSMSLNQILKLFRIGQDGKTGAVNINQAIFSFM